MAGDDRRFEELAVTGGNGSERQRIGSAHDGSSDADRLDQRLHSGDGEREVLGWDLLQCRVMYAELSRGSDPSAAPVIADRGPMGPAEVANLLIALANQVTHTLGDACPAVDVSTGGEARVCPTPCRRTRRGHRAPATSQVADPLAGCCSARPADYLGGEQPLVLRNGFEMVLDGEGDDVGILFTGSDGELHQESVLAWPVRVFR